MGSIVIELQREALDSSTSLADVLRKALVVSTKLAIGEFSDWILKELNGYPSAEGIPAYRRVKGELKAWNPVHGWIPVKMDNAPAMDYVSQNVIIQSVGEIETITTRTQKGSDLVRMSIDSAIELELDRHGSFPTKYSLFVPMSQLQAILGIVRNTVLKWSLELERDGILGEGLSFSAEEKRAAQQHIQNLNYFFGNVTNSQIQQGSRQSTQTMNIQEPNVAEVAKFVHDLKQAIPTLNLDESSRSELVAEVGTLEAQIASPKPKHKIIRESLHSTRSILENAAGNALGNAMSGAAGAALLAAVLKLLGIQ